jgi:hypothetical protein
MELWGEPMCSVHKNFKNKISEISVYKSNIWLLYKTEAKKKKSNRKNKMLTFVHNY